MINVQFSPGAVRIVQYICNNRLKVFGKTVAGRVACDLAQSLRQTRYSDLDLSDRLLVLMHISIPFFQEQYVIGTP